MSEYLGCPFCHCRDVVFTMRHPSYGCCTSCGARGPESSTPEMAISAWNDRGGTLAEVPEDPSGWSALASQLGKAIR